MKRMTLGMIAALLSATLLLCGCAPAATADASTGHAWCMGFASAEIALPAHTTSPLYIAGYRNGREIDGVLDMPRASAVWLDTGEWGVLLIGIDCVGCGSGTVEEIRRGLSAFCRETSCVAVHVYATHTHAGVDTLGLWGPVAIDGKNPDYMQQLVDAAIVAAKGAYADRSVGTLSYGCADAGALLHDSREPVTFDPNIHQLRFVSDDAAQNGIRLLSYAAHAESLRGDNTLLSRDFPGALADMLHAQCGDDVMYMPGAIGGLIMTRELVAPFDAVENMHRTAARLAETVLSITEEQTLTPRLSYAQERIKLPLDNTFFFFGRFLGILDHEISRGKSDTGYLLHTELGVLSLGEVTLALIPGEIFPELVSGEGLTQDDPEALADIAARHGIERLLVVGLCNDEIGYIVPPSAFLLHDELPYIETVEDADGENHYEETNSVSIHTARLLAEAFARALTRCSSPAA